MQSNAGIHNHKHKANTVATNKKFAIKTTKLGGTSKEVIAALEDLTNRNSGLLRPEDVVEAARDSESPLHAYFDWNDSSAAEKFRLQQARTVIRSVTISWVEPAGPRRVEATVASSRAFVNTYRDGTGYEHIDTVLSDSEKRARLLAQALEDLVAVQNRYSNLQELAEVRIAIGSFAKKVTEYEKKIAKPAPKRKAA